MKNIIKIGLALLTILALSSCIILSDPGTSYARTSYTPAYVDVNYLTSFADPDDPPNAYWSEGYEQTSEGTYSYSYSYLSTTYPYYYVTITGTYSINVDYGEMGIYFIGGDWPSVDSGDDYRYTLTLTTDGSGLVPTYTVDTRSLDEDSSFPLVHEETRDTDEGTEYVKIYDVEGRPVTVIYTISVS